MTLAVSKGMSEEYMYVPLIQAGFGHVGVFIVLTVYAQAKANFQYYFQTLCLLGFIRTGIGGPIYDHIRGGRHLPDNALKIPETEGHKLTDNFLILP